MFNLILAIMKNGLFKRIGAGIVNGFPLIQSIVKNVKGVQQTPTVPTDGQPAEPPKQFDIVSLIFELATVGLIFCFVTGRITMEDLERLLGLIKQ